MSFALQNLMYKVSMLDHVSGTAGKIMKSMDTMTNKIQSGYRKVGYGVAGVVGAGYGMERLLSPAKQMAHAIGEVKSLDVADATLNKLTSTALKFSMQYGNSATDFVSSSYDIQSAISGLVGNELSQFTNASAILAKGTKSDSATITNYMGTMYGIFKDNANQMGKSKWVEMLTGQTAAAVQMFKTTGSEMSSAFTTLGADAQTHGIKLGNQMAILGTLQSSMSGSEAGTKYKSFLAGVGKAQKSLGLQFTDSQGRMLPMIDILHKIRGKFGDIDTVAESDWLQKAFGRKEAVSLIKLLSNDIGGLNKSIISIGQNKGMAKAEQMANAITDPWHRAKQSVTAFNIVFGQKLLQVMTPVYNQISAVSGKFIQWMDMFPHLTGFMAKTLVGVTALIIGVSTLSIVVGVSKVAFGGMSIVLGVVKFALMPFGPLLKAMKLGWITMTLAMRAGTGIMAAMRIGWGAFLVTLKANIVASKAYTAWLWLKNTAMGASLLGVTLLYGSFGVLKASILTALPAIWGFTTALLANPVTWIVLGVVALIGAVAAAVIYWDEWTDAVVNSAKAFGQWVGSFAVFDNVSAIWDSVLGRWDGFKAQFSEFDLLSFLSMSNPANKISAGWDWVSNQWNSFKNQFSEFDLMSYLTSSSSGNKSVAGWDWVSSKWISFKSQFSEFDLMSFLFSRSFGNHIIAGWDWVSNKWISFKSHFSEFDLMSFLSSRSFGNHIIAGWDLVSNKWISFKNQFSEFDLLSFLSMSNPADKFSAGWDWVSNKWISFKSQFSEFDLMSFLSMSNPADKFSAGWDWVSNKWISFQSQFSEFDLMSFLSMGNPGDRFSGFLDSISVRWTQFTGNFSSFDLFSLLVIIDPMAKINEMFIFIQSGWSNLKNWFAQLDMMSFLFSMDFYDRLTAVWDFIAQGWSNLKQWFNSFNLFEFMGDQFNWIIDKLNYIPGIDIAMNEAPQAPQLSDNVKPFQNVTAPPQGGIMKQVSNMTNNSSKNQTIQVTVQNYGQAMNGAQLADEIAMAGG